MATFETKDGTTIYYKDWGTAEKGTFVFSHGWPLSSDAWEDQMFYLASNGYRVIAHDRRGHGRSSQPWTGNNMDTYADDLSQLFEKLSLTDVVLVGHSTGGGEVTRYMTRHGTSRVKGAVLISAVVPGMVKSANNPDGLPMSVFDGIREGMTKDRSQLLKDFTAAFYGANRPGSTVSQGLRDTFWLIGMQGGFKNLYDCIAAFSETDFTDEVQKLDVPLLIIHGDDDQIVPIDISAKRLSTLMPSATLKVYQGADHGLPSTHKDRINEDLSSFAASLTQPLKKSA